MWLSVFIMLLSYAIGGFHNQLITKETRDLLEAITPDAEYFLHKKGFNGVFPKGFPVEWLVKVVNGKYHALKISYDTMPESTCVLIYEDIYNKYTVENVKFCNIITEITT